MFNHPEDTGEDAAPPTVGLATPAPSVGPAAPAPTPIPASPAPTAGPAAPPAIPGSKSIPARFKLKAFISTTADSAAPGFKATSARFKPKALHTGHYVAHIRVNGQWLLFNDEKVVKADDERVKELKKLAYLYFFERV